MELYKAVNDNNISEVKRLLETNININYQSPLYLACQKNFTEIIKILLNDKRTDINLGDILNTPINIAYRNNNYEIMMAFLNDHRLNTNIIFIINNNTLLHEICYSLNSEALKLCVFDARFDLNFQNYEGDTCLHYLINNSLEAIKCFKIILSSGRYLNLNLKNKFNETIKDIAIKLNIIEIINIIEKYEKNKENIIKELRKELSLNSLTINEKFIYICTDGMIDKIKIFLKKNLKYKK